MIRKSKHANECARIEGFGVGFGDADPAQARSACRFRNGFGAIERVKKHPCMGEQSRARIVGIETNSYRLSDRFDMADRSLSSSLVRVSMLLGMCLVVGCSAGYGPSNYDPDAPTEFTTTESGLKYRILRKSDKKKPDAGSHVKVHYIGTLDDGTVFDSTYAKGKPATLNLYNVVKGWSEGIQLVGEGGMIELEIPPELGYGELGQRNAVPPNSTIHFIVELIRVFDR